LGQAFPPLYNHNQNVPRPDNPMLLNMFGLDGQQNAGNQGFAPPMTVPMIGNMGYLDQNTPRNANYFDGNSGQFMGNGFGQPNPYNAPPPQNNFNNYGY